MLTGNLQFYPEKVNYQIDKCHRIGPINTKDGTQSTIFQFKTHSFREALYLKRKKCHKKQENKLSLIKGRRKTVAYVYNNAGKLPEIDFFYADIHGNLKFRLKNAIYKKFVYSFRDELVSKPI